MSLMRSPSARCWPHEVTLTLNTWGTDADGGRIVVSTQTVRQVDCSVQPGRPVREVTTDKDDGSRRITQFIPTILIFPENPRLKVDDLVTWLDSDGGPDAETHIFQVQGKRDASGLRSVWEVHCIERI
jgi:hypothetical protein